MHWKSNNQWINQSVNQFYVGLGFPQYPSQRFILSIKRLTINETLKETNVNKFKVITLMIHDIFSYSYDWSKGLRCLDKAKEYQSDIFRLKFAGGPQYKPVEAN